MSDASISENTADRPLQIGVLGSGFGSNFRAFHQKIKNDGINAEIVCVGSDVPGAPILDYAREQGCRTFSIEPGKFKSSLEPHIESKLVHTLQDHGVELVVLAGFMKILKHEMLNAFRGQIINIHPSLLPKYKGMHAWKQALNSGDSVTGCTVHYVDSGVDTGEIIAQAEVDIKPGDTPETLHSRIQQAEHLLLPMVIEEFSKQRRAFLEQLKSRLPERSLAKENTLS